MSNIKKYLSLIDTNFIGQIENADIEIIDSVCDKFSQNKDKYSIYIKLDNGIIKEIKGGCGPCTPAAYISLNIIMKLLKNKNISNIKNKGNIEKEFFDILPEENIFKDYFNRILKMLSSKISE